MQKSNSLHHWRYGTPWLLCFNSPRVHDLYNGIWIQSYSNRSIETQVWSGEFCRHGLLPLQERAHNCHRQTVHCPELAKSCQSRLKKLPSLGMLWWNFFIPESSEWAPNGSKSLSIGGKHAMNVMAFANALSSRILTMEFLPRVWFLQLVRKNIVWECHQITMLPWNVPLTQAQALTSDKGQTD